MQDYFSGNIGDATVNFYPSAHFNTNSLEAAKEILFFRIDQDNGGSVKTLLPSSAGEISLMCLMKGLPLE